MCRSRRALSNEYLFGQIGFDTAENGPWKFCSFDSPECPRFLRSDLGEDDDLAARLKKLRARVENKLRGGKREKSKYSDYAKEKLKGFRKQNEFGAKLRWH